jgi:hypothetical protein
MTWKFATDFETNYFRYQVAPYGRDNILKLLKHFKNQYVPTVLASKVDRDEFVGIKLTSDKEMGYLSYLILIDVKKRGKYIFPHLYHASNLLILSGYDYEGYRWVPIQSLEIIFENFWKDLVADGVVKDLRYWFR